MKRKIEHVRLRQYADGNETPTAMVIGFLQEVEWATRADISGATGLAWATVHGCLEDIDRAHHLVTRSDVTPWEYAWKD